MKLTGILSNLPTASSNLPEFVRDPAGALAKSIETSNEETLTEKQKQVRENMKLDLARSLVAEAETKPEIKNE